MPVSVYYLLINSHNSDFETLLTFNTTAVIHTRLLMQNQKKSEAVGIFRSNKQNKRTKNSLISVLKNNKHHLLMSNCHKKHIYSPAKKIKIYHHKNDYTYSIIWQNQQAYTALSKTSYMSWSAVRMLSVAHMSLSDIFSLVFAQL